MDSVSKKSGSKLFAKFIARMKRDKKFELAVYGALGIIAVLLLIWPAGERSRQAKDAAGGGALTLEQRTRAEDEIEARLEEILSNIRGAGKVKVMITYETSTQIVPAMSTDVQSSTSRSSGETVSESTTESSQPATLSKNGGYEPIVLTEIQPKIRGVIVIAEGAADIKVRVSLLNAVMTVLGIDADSIDVFEMKQDNGGTQ